MVGGTGLYMRGALADLSLTRQEESELWSADTRHPTLLVGLNMDRERLYERIDRRVEAIVAAGAEAEVRRGGRGRRRPRARRWASTSCWRATSTRLKQRSRNYARRQLTWMRKMAGLVEIDVTGTGTSRGGRRGRDSAMLRRAEEAP